MGKYVKRIVMEMIIILQKDKTILIADTVQNFV